MANRKRVVIARNSNKHIFKKGQVCELLTVYDTDAGGGRKFRMYKIAGKWLGHPLGLKVSQHLERHDFRFVKGGR